MFLRKTAIFVFSYYLISFHLVFSVGEQCENSWQCNKPVDYVKCAYCDRRTNTSRGSCLNIDEKIFSKILPCEYSNSHCVNESCQASDRQPYEGYGECVCFCRDSFYGQQCSHRNQSGFRYPGAIQLLFAQHIDFYKPVPLFISVGQGPKDKSQLSRLSFVIQDLAGGFAARLNIPTLDRPSAANEYCKNESKNLPEGNEKCRFIKESTAEYLYMAPVSIPFLWSTPVKDKPTSFIRQMELIAYWDDIVISKQVHNYHLFAPWPTDLYYHRPNYFIVNAGATLATARVHQYKDAVKVGVIPKTAVDPSYQIKFVREAFVKCIWKIYKFEGDTYKNMVEYNEYTYRDINECIYINLPPFKMIGTYAINVTLWWAFFIEDADGEEIYQYEIRWYLPMFYMSFVKYVYSPLEAKLDGGASRFIYKENRLILDASGSSNPNDPNPKSKLVYTFFCNWTMESICKPHTTYGNLKKYSIKQYSLEPNKAYNFTLKVSSNDFKDAAPGYASQIIIVGEAGKGDDLLNEVLIECVYNCDDLWNPKDIIYLRVKGHWKVLNSIDFQWEIKQLDVNGVPVDNVNVGSMRQTDTPSFIFIFKERILKENTAYDSKVNYTNSSQFATYYSSTSNSVTLSCQVRPESGVAGVTNFDLNCNALGSTETCEIYEKYASDEPGFSGRMIAAQETCSLNKIILTREKLVIFAFDQYGTESSIIIDTQLTTNNDTTYNTIREFETLKESDLMSVKELLIKLSTLCDLLGFLPQESLNKNLEILLKRLKMLHLESYEDTKQGISILHNALRYANGSLSIEATLTTAGILEMLTKSLSAELRKDCKCTFKVLYQIYGLVLDCFYLLLAIKSKYIRKDFQSQLYTEPLIYKQSMEISKLTMESLAHLQTALTYRQLPAQAYSSVRSNVGDVSMSVMVDIPLTLRNYTQDSLNKVPVLISDDLAASVTADGYYLVIHYVNLKINPVNFQKTNTDLFYVTVAYKDSSSMSCIYQKLKYGIKVVFDVTELINKFEYKEIIISTSWLESNKNDQLLAELKLTVFKIDPIPLSKVDAHFRFHDNETELIVMVVRDMRPTLESLLKNGTAVTPASPIFKVITEPSNDQHLYYLAIHPHPQAKNDYTTISFDMKMYSKTCYTWHKEWETSACQAIADPRTGVLVCECNRLSLVGGLVKEVTFPLDTVSDFPMYVTQNNNDYLLTYLLLSSLCLFLLVLICNKADCHDKSRRYVTIVPDNMPGDKNGYLVCVVTGCRVGSGTDAAVGIQISGHDTHGRSHFLDSDKPVMTGMGEDWFLLYEPTHLGRIELVDLWHDNSGARPEWFCDSIIIYDLKHENCYFFLVDDWIALNLNRFPEVVLIPATLSQITDPSRVFINNVRSGFHLSHVWLDIIFKHPRDPVSRIDKLAIIMCFVCTSMLVSITLMTIGNNIGESDDYSYFLTGEMIELSIYTCIPSTVVARLIMWAFGRMYKIVYFRETQKPTSSGETVLTRVSFQEDYLTVPLTITQDDNHLHYGPRHKKLHDEQKERPLVEKINLMLIPKPLLPLQLKGDEPNVTVKQSWLFLTWTVVVVIVVSCLVASVILSYHLPPVKTKKWFTIIFLSAIIHALIYLPIKIHFISTLLALAFKRLIYKDVYSFDPKDGRRNEFYGDTEFLKQLITLKSHQIYKPYHEVFREQCRQKLVRARRWQRLYSMFIQILFLVVIGTLLTSNLSNAYQAKSHLHTLMNDFYEVHNTTDVINYFKNHLAQYLFEYSWYNWETINQDSEKDYFRKDWLTDRVSRMVGKVTLTQVRVKPGYCESPLNLSIQCSAPITKSSEDSRDYLPSWVTYEKHDTSSKSFSSKLNLDFESIHNWSYSRRDDSTYFYGGVTGNAYSFAGYTWDLNAFQKDYDVSVEKMEEEGWIDHYTRAILMQTTVYNVNTRLFSEIVLIAEQTVTGQVLTTVVIKSIDINLNVDWWLAAFVFITFMLNIKVFRLANFIGVMGLFTKWIYLFEVLMLVSGVAVLFYLLLHQTTVPKYLAEYQELSEELHFFDFFMLSFYLFTARTFLYVFYIFNQIRFYSLWRFGQSVYIFFLTVVLSMKIVVFLIPMYLGMLFLVFRATGYNSLMCNDVGFSPNRYFRFTLNCHSYKIASSKLLYSAVNFVNVTVMVFLFCIFTNRFKAAKLKCVNNEDIDNHFTFVAREFKRLLSTRLKRRIRMKKSMYC